MALLQEQTVRADVPRIRVTRDLVKRIVVFLLLLGIVLLFVVPIIWMVLTSFQPETQIFNPSAGWIPVHWMWSNYVKALEYFPYLLYLKNTLTITVPATAGIVVSSAFVAYGLSHLKWRGQNAVFYVVLSHMVIPVWVTIIPLYIIFSHIHWINTYWPLIVPHLFGSAFSVFLYRQFFLKQPTAVLDAARIDGASELRIFAQIVMPMAQPAILVVTLLNFVWTWTDFFGPLVFLNDPNKYTLMLGLAVFEGKHLTLWPELMAANVMVIAPVLLIFALAQRQFIEGINLTGTVG
ncbi:MAG: carbohydrate ABC transporter permease [Firmicutes bacterium]|nr:carbohydrate ABC transporter permease [Bacillota bacterium]